MAKAYRHLTGNEESAVRMRNEGATFAAIGATLGVTRERARQIVAKARRKLAKLSAAVLGDRNAPLGDRLGALYQAMGQDDFRVTAAVLDIVLDATRAVSLDRRYRRKARHHWPQPTQA